MCMICVLVELLSSMVISSVGSSALLMEGCGLTAVFRNLLRVAPAIIAETFVSGTVTKDSNGDKASERGQGVGMLRGIFVILLSLIEIGNCSEAKTKARLETW